MATGFLGFGGGLSGGTFSDFGGAISDLYAVSADKYRAAGARIEAEQYGLAASLADQNAQFTKVSTDIKEFQTQRALNLTLGKQQADIASSGFAESGSALDIERDSATQGAIAKAVLGAQGQIEEASYEEQAASFRLMQEAANNAATAADHAASGAMWGAAIKGAAGIATLL